MTEPFALIACTLIGAGLLLLREWRRRLAHRHIKAEAEIMALRRVGPLFASIRDELSAQLPVLLSRERPAGPDKSQALTDRALDRLAVVSGRLDQLLEGESPPAERTEAAASEAEQRLFANDARGAATVYLLLWLIIVLLGFLFPLPWVAESSLLRWGGMVGFPIATMVFLWAPGRRLTQDQILWVILAFALVVLGFVTVNQFFYARLTRPYEPLTGHKLTMVVVGVTVGHRLWLRVALILLTATTALALYFGLHLNARHDLFPLTEPWLTFVYMAVALAATVLRDQRRLASLQLLRAETEVSALQRRALMFLALRDQFNSPIQSLMLSQAIQPTHSEESVQTGISRLAALSHQLAELDATLATDVHRAGFDAAQELRRNA